MTENSDVDGGESLADKMRMSRRKFVAALGTGTGAAMLGSASSSNGGEQLSMGGVTNLTDQMRRDTYVTSPSSAFDPSALKENEWFWVSDTGELGIKGPNGPEHPGIGSASQPVPAVHTEKIGDKYGFVFASEHKSLQDAVDAAEPGGVVVIDAEIKTSVYGSATVGRSVGIWGTAQGIDGTSGSIEGGKIVQDTNVTPLTFQNDSGKNRMRQALRGVGFEVPSGNTPSADMISVQDTNMWVAEDIFWQMRSGTGNCLTMSGTVEAGAIHRYTATSVSGTAFDIQNFNRDFTIGRGNISSEAASGTAVIQYTETSNAEGQVRIIAPMIEGVGTGTAIRYVGSDSEGGIVIDTPYLRDFDTGIELGGSNTGERARYAEVKNAKIQSIDQYAVDIVDCQFFNLHSFQEIPVGATSGKAFNFQSAIQGSVGLKSGQSEAQAFNGTAGSVRFHYETPMNNTQQGNIVDVIAGTYIPYQVNDGVPIYYNGTGWVSVIDGTTV